MVSQPPSVTSTKLHAGLDQPAGQQAALAEICCRHKRSAIGWRFALQVERLRFAIASGRRPADKWCGAPARDRVVLRQEALFHLLEQAKAVVELALAY